MKRKMPRVLTGLCFGALACSAGAFYSVLNTTPSEFVPVTTPSYVDANNVEAIIASPSAASVPQLSVAPSPTKRTTVKAAVNEVPEPEPAPENSWVEIKPNPEDPTNAQGRYVGPTRSPSH